jgi:hypothetical protein
MAEETKVDDRRTFLGSDGETEYFIAAPTAEDIRGADWQYSKIYTQSLVEGITTSAEMMDILMRRGIIGPEFEQRAQELSNDLSENIQALEDAESTDDKRELAVKVAQAREELFQWNQRLNGPMNNTCEQIADDARLEYLTSCIIQDKEGNRIWDSLDEYMKDKNQTLAVKARFEVMLYLQGLDSDFLEQTPEARAMKEVEDDIISKAQEALKAVRAAEEEEKAAKEEKASKNTKKKSAKKSSKKKTDEEKSEE